jgi:hypothetical protein
MVMELKIGDLVRYLGDYYKVVVVHNNRRMVDLENPSERINRVYSSDCEKLVDQ